MFTWRQDVGPYARLALTGRAGGISRAPYDTLDLGDHVGDDPAAVAANRGLVATAVGVPAPRLLFARQVHGTRVVVAEGPWDGRPGEPPEADALVTSVPGLALGILVADCAPVLLAAPDEGVVAVAHAGRRGMADGVLAATVTAMRRLGGRRILGWIGPSVCGRCYEVPAALAAQVGAAVPASIASTRAGTPALDIAAGLLAQGRDLGIGLAAVPGCTMERDDLFSYRRDGATGRFAGLAWLEAA